MVEVLQRALPDTKAAYCLLFLMSDRLVAVRDSLGVRPLCIGRLGDIESPGGAGYIIASESAALDIVGATLVRDVEPGEVVTVSAKGLESSYLTSNDGAPKNRAMCSFEFIYFARPDSVMMGRSLYEARVAMGRELGKEAPVDADIVITLPDSGTPAALGYAEASGVRFVEGMIKSRYVTRTFIQPSQHLRDSDIRLKFNPMRHVLGGKKVIVVDDSIVRGTTSRRLVEEIRRAGASEVHMRIASPPLAWPCFMGIDIASRNELIAAHHDEAEIATLVGADSLRYLSIGGLRRAVGHPDGDGFCFACFTGQYPVPVPERLEADKLALDARRRARRTQSAAQRERSQDRAGVARYARSVGGARYADSGVDIGEGNRAVELIRQTVQATHSPAVLAGLGGFGVDVRPGRRKPPPACPRLEHRLGRDQLKIAIATGRHRGIGVDLVNHCVNDVLCCGAEPLFFLDYYATGELRAEHLAEIVEGMAEACRRDGDGAHRRRDRRAAGPIRARRL